VKDVERHTLWLRTYKNKDGELEPIAVPVKINFLSSM